MEGRDGQPGSNRSQSVRQNRDTTQCYLLEPLDQGFESWDSGFTRGRSFQIRIPQQNYSLLYYYGKEHQGDEVDSADAVLADKNV